MWARAEVGGLLPKQFSADGVTDGPQELHESTPPT